MKRLGIIWVSHAYFLNYLKYIIFASYAFFINVQKAPMNIIPIQLEKAETRLDRGLGSLARTNCLIAVCKTIDLQKRRFYGAFFIRKDAFNIYPCPYRLSQ